MYLNTIQIIGFVGKDPERRQLQGNDAAYTGDEPPKKPKLPPAKRAEPLWGTSGKTWPELRRLAMALHRMDERRRKLLFLLAQGISRRKHAN
jgi:hypothetical protein